MIHFLYEGFDRLIGGDKKHEWQHTSEPLTAQQEREGYDLRVPKTALDSHCYGHAEASFSVDSVSGIGRSKRQSVYVDMRVSGICPPGA